MIDNYLQHLSQKNLSSAFNVSVELKFFKQLVIELFCSISRLKSKNVSSLAVTVSHRKHLVSLVSIPWLKQQLKIMRFLIIKPKRVVILYDNVKCGNELRISQ